MLHLQKCGKNVTVFTTTFQLIYINPEVLTFSKGQILSSGFLEEWSSLLRLSPLLIIVTNCEQNTEGTIWRNIEQAAVREHVSFEVCIYFSSVEFSTLHRIPNVHSRTSSNLIGFKCWSLDFRTVTQAGEREERYSQKEDHRHVCLNFIKFSSHS